MHGLGTIVTALGAGLRASSPHTTGAEIVERVTVSSWLTGFALAGSTLTEDHLHRLSILAGAFYLVPHPSFEMPAHDPDARVTRLVGHASRTGRETHNHALGLARAEAVRAALQSLGLPAMTLPEPESMGSLGNPPTAVAGSLDDMTLGGEMPEHRAVEMVVEFTVARQRVDTIDWDQVIGSAGLPPSVAREFWYSYGGVTSDVVLGAGSVVVAILDMVSTTTAVVVGGGAVQLLGAVMVPIGAVMSIWQALDGQEKRLRLYAMAYQGADWVMEPRFLVSRGAIPRPEQPERFWKTLDVPDAHASDGDRAEAKARRQHWRDGADMMQEQLRAAVQQQYELVVSSLPATQAPEARLEDVEQALRYAIRRNASGSPDRLATGREVLAHIYEGLIAQAGVPGMRHASDVGYPSSTFR